MLIRVSQLLVILFLWPAAFLTGCQSYEPQPPDLAAHHQAWIERAPEVVNVASYAASLRHASKAPDAQDAQDGITLQQAEAIALLYNADLRRARARAGVSEATMDHAGLWDDPVVTAGIERILANVDHPWESMVSIGFTLPLSGRLEAEKKRAGAAHHAALYAVAEQEWRTRFQVRRAWIEWSAADRKRMTAEEFLERLERIITITDRMEEVGELARIEARLFRIDHAKRRNEARAIAGLVQERAIELSRLMGLAPNSAWQPVPQLVIKDDADETIDPASRLRERHPRILRLLAEYETAERQLALEVRKQYPDLVIGPGHGYEDGSNRVLLGLSMPLPIFNRNRLSIAEATAQREESLAALETEYEALLSDLTFAGIEHEAAADQLNRMHETIIPLVDAQYADARRIAEVGEVDTLLLLDTLRRQYEAKLELIDLEAQRSLARVRIAELLGPVDEAPDAASFVGREKHAEEIAR